jgi:cephalosporin-C deacetylase-like acetyl esterase/lysophospholipase L1-like esterase
MQNPKMMRAHKIVAVCTYSFAWLVAASAGAAEPLTFTPYNKTGIYELGEKVGWTVAVAEGEKAPSGSFKFTIKKNNFEPVDSGTFDLSVGTAKIEVSIDEPAMVFVQVTPPAEEGAGGIADGNRNRRGIALGAAVAPTKLKPAALRPADFDEFWQAKIKELKEIPENPELTPGESGKANVEYSTIKMDHVHGTHVYGQLAKPKREGKFPALVIFQWASPPYPLQKPWVTDRAAEGWLTLNIEPHDVLPDQPKAYYDALPREIKNYQSIGNNDREKSYFLDMYLRDYRAVDYMAGREDWDGKTLVVMGTSMGGQQSLCVAGLHPKITHLIVNEPAGCDTNGPLHGRQSGYPNFPSSDPAIMQTAVYFDAVNFAPHIKATSLVAMGFVDTIAPPTGIWTAFDEINAAKEAAPMIDSPHNNLATAAQQQPYTQRSAEWLNALVKGEDLKVAEVVDQPVAKKVVGIPRSDKNSQIAHEQLLEKAKRGGIDIYFIGDSITRRWGTSDALYKNMLANWNENFFGWNAGDFGWGADTIENILWRLENGELDGVHPKVIVILAGTNNVGNRPGDEAKIARIAQGIKAILGICREKAPDAKIVLTAIFPRNDNINDNVAVVPTIKQINERIAKFADGDRIRFLNVNDKLADGDGKLFPGMMGDRLHPTVKGYQVWADGLKPILAEWLGPPAKTDHAPPPTGDPSAARPSAETNNSQDKK